MNAVTTKFVHTSTNKNRCPVNVIRVGAYSHGKEELCYLHYGILTLRLVDLCNSGPLKDDVWLLDHQAVNSHSGMD
jgi:hypothetical protein